MDSLTYMANPYMVGFKLCNLQYRNTVDCDNQFKVEPLWRDEELGREEAEVIRRNVSIFKYRRRRRNARDF